MAMAHKFMKQKRGCIKESQLRVKYQHIFRHPVCVVIMHVNIKFCRPEPDIALACSQEWVFCSAQTQNVNHLVITSHPNLGLHKLRSKKPESKKDIYHFQMDNGADIVTSLERKVINAVVNASPKAGKARVQLVNVFVVV